MLAERPGLAKSGPLPTGSGATLRQQLRGIEVHQMHNTSNVSESVAEAPLAAIAAHPLRAEATSWGYCTSDVFVQSKNFVDRARISDEQKSSLHQALDSVSTVLIVACWTSPDKPKPMSGFGKLYPFLLHPETFAVLQADISIWRS
jgi:hypothetical protein